MNTFGCWLLVSNPALANALNLGALMCETFTRAASPRRHTCDMHALAARVACMSNMKSASENNTSVLTMKYLLTRTDMHNNWRFKRLVALWKVTH